PRRGVTRRPRLLTDCGVRSRPVHRPCVALELSGHRRDESHGARDVAPVEIGVAADEPTSILWPPEIGWLRELPIGTLDLGCRGDGTTDQVVATVRQIE